MWTRAADLYGQFPSVRNIWASQPASPAAASPSRATNTDSASDSRSYRTAHEGAPDLRLYSPDGGEYAPSVPSSGAFRNERSARGAAVAEGAADGLPQTASPAGARVVQRAVPALVAAQRAAPASVPVDSAPSPAPAAPPAAPPSVTCPTVVHGQPTLAGGLMERLKAQRSARSAQVGKAVPVAASDPSSRPRAPVPASSGTPRPTVVPELSGAGRAPSVRASPPLQPFDSPPTSSERPPFASSDGSYAAGVPEHFSAAYGGSAEPSHQHDYSPAYLGYNSPAYSRDMSPYGLPQTHGAANTLRSPARVASRASDRTVLHEASVRPPHGPITAPLHRAAQVFVSSTPPPPVPAPALSFEAYQGEQRAAAGPTSRAELLKWERCRRAETRGAAAVESPPAMGHEGTVRSSWGWEAATEGLREGRRKDAESARGEEVEKDEILIQDWLLVPPPERPVTDGLLSFPDLWHPVYAVLTPSHMHLVLPEDHDGPVAAFAVSDFARTNHEAKYSRSGFEPFFVELKSGERLYFAGMRELDGALWTLKLNNAHSGAFRRSSTLSDLPDVPSSSSSSTRTSSRSTRLHKRHASSPPTTISAPLPPYAVPPDLANDLAHRQKDSRWIQDFHAVVRALPVLEELPPHAGADDWGATAAWPARPPTEVYAPPSSVQAQAKTHAVDGQHALELAVMRDRLEFVRAMLDGDQEGIEVDQGAAREAAQELRAMREAVRRGAEKERRELTRDEERLVEKILWVEHLNASRLHPSAEQLELAQATEEEECRAEELQRELEALVAAGNGGGQWQWGDGREGEGKWEGGENRPSTRQDEEYDAHASRNPRHRHTSSLPARQAGLASKFSSNTSAPLGYHYSAHYPAAGGLSPIPPSVDPQAAHYRHAEHAVPQPQYDSDFSFQAASEDKDAARQAERRRRLQELFLELEQRILDQKRYLALSEDKNRQLTRTLGKALHLVEHSTHLYTSQLSSLIARLDTLTAQLHPPAPHLGVRKAPLAAATSSRTSMTPTPPPPYFPTSPLAHRAVPPGGMLRKQSMALVPGDGRMAPRLMTRRMAEALAQARPAAQEAAKGGKGKVKVGGPILGVDPPLPKPAHEARWVAGAEAARRARQVEALEQRLAAPPVPTAAARKGGQGELGRELAENERVRAAVEELRRGGGGKAGDPAKSALAVWELLDGARRARREEEKRRRAEGKRGRMHAI